MHANKLPNAEKIKDIEVIELVTSDVYFSFDKWLVWINTLIAFLPATAENTTLRKPALAKETQISVLWSRIATCNIEKNANPDKENTTKMLHAPATLMNSEKLIEYYESITVVFRDI